MSVYTLEMRLAKASSELVNAARRGGLSFKDALMVVRTAWADAVTRDAATSARLRRKSEPAAKPKRSGERKPRERE